MCVALFSGTGSELSEEEEEWWEYVEEVAIAEEEPARLALPCPPHRSTNTAPGRHGGARRRCMAGMPWEAVGCSRRRSWCDTEPPSVVGCVHATEAVSDS